MQEIFELIEQRERRLRDEAIRRLGLRGVVDPRLSPGVDSAANLFDRARAYDELLTAEINIVRSIMRRID